MVFSKIASSALSAALAAAATAPQFLHNPKQVVAIADFPYGFDKLVEGNIVFTAPDAGPVNVHVDMTGLPAEPVVYHVHHGSVPADGNCDALGAILDPFAGDAVCGADVAQCQVGNLSGKHGAGQGPIFEQKYVDSFLSLDTAASANIVGQSVAFHFANGTKFACATIVPANKVRLASLKEEYFASGNGGLAFLEEIDGAFDAAFDCDTTTASATSVLSETASASSGAQLPSLSVPATNATYGNVTIASDWNCSSPEEPAPKTSICEDSAAAVGASFLSFLGLLALL